MVRLGLIWSRLRLDEKMLIAAADKRGVDLVTIDERDLVLDVRQPPVELLGLDAVLNRSVRYHAGLHLTLALESYGIPVLNPASVVRACGDKVETSLRLARAGVPTPDTYLAFDERSAMAAVAAAGYPVVLKPAIGSWGRLVHRAPNAETAEALLETRQVLGGAHHQTTYAQSHVDKPGRDIRAFWVQGRVIAAIYRHNDAHFLTNTAKGATVSACPITPEIEAISAQAAAAVGGGILALDLMESADGLVCHEVNHTMEFKNSVAPTGVDIPAHVIEHAIEVAKGGAYTG